MTTISPKPTQVSGALFLAGSNAALLADEPRVGKTGAAIMACDYVAARSILVITTASGRSVWHRAFEDWSTFDRSVEIAINARTGSCRCDVVIIGWPTLNKPTVMALLIRRHWDVVIPDEDHYAKNFDAKRTQALYGKLQDGGGHLDNISALYARADRVWPLTGTPLPHSPADGYPRLRALAPSRLEANSEKGWPDVTRYQDFLHRYCVVRMKKLPRGFQKIPVVVGGKNLPELKERMRGFMLLRTQQDVGIQPPIYDTLPLLSDSSALNDLLASEKDVDRKSVLEAAKNGETKSLDMHLGPLRRLTGELKAEAVIGAVKEEMECGIPKIVLAYWHRSVGEILLHGLSALGVVGIDGSTPSTKRTEHVDRFSTDSKCRVFLAQIEAAGEAIDLSAAAELWFVETVFSPRMMKQMSLRITNHNQRRQAVVKVCTLAGSIDEALQASLMRLWTAIREVLKQ